MNHSGKASGSDKRSTFPNMISPSSGQHRLSVKHQKGNSKERRSIQVSKLNDSVGFDPAKKGQESRFNVRSSNDLTHPASFEQSSSSSHSGKVKEENPDDVINREFQQIETNLKEQRKRKLERKLGNTVDESAMKHLNLDFDQFDQAKHL